MDKYSLRNIVLEGIVLLVVVWVYSVITGIKSYL